MKVDFMRDIIKVLDTTTEPLTIFQCDVIRDILRDYEVIKQ